MNTEGIQLRPHKYPSNWEVKQLEEICLQNGLVRGPFGGSLKKEFFTKDGYKVYEQKNAIYRDSEVGSYYIDKGKFNELKRFEVHENDFIVSCSGTIGKIFLMPKGAEPGVINQALLLIKINSNIINQQFFYSYFEWENFQKSIIDNTQGGAMQNLVGMEIFRKTYIPIPPLHEQRAIAEALSDMGALIAAQEALIAKKRAIKQGVMQELLTGKRRLPGFSEEWAEKTIGELLEYEQPTKYIVSSTEYSHNNEIPVLTANKSFILGYTNETHGVYTNIPAIIFDDFTTDMKFVDFPFKVKSSGMKILKPKNENVDLRYVYEKMKTINFKIGDHKRYYISEYQHIKITVPDIKEQKAVSMIISSIENEISALEHKLDKTKVIKQGMMQELLTGRVRLTGV